MSRHTWLQSAKRKRGFAEGTQPRQGHAHTHERREDWGRRPCSTHRRIQSAGGRSRGCPEEDEDEAAEPTRCHGSRLLPRQVGGRRRRVYVPATSPTVHLLTALGLSACKRHHLYPHPDHVLCVCPCVLVAVALCCASEAPRRYSGQVEAGVSVPLPSSDHGLGARDYWVATPTSSTFLRARWQPM